MFAAVFFVVPIAVGALPHKIMGFAPYLPSSAGQVWWCRGHAPRAGRTAEVASARA